MGVCIGLWLCIVLCSSNLAIVSILEEREGEREREMAALLCVYC